MLFYGLHACYWNEMAKPNLFEIALRNIKKPWNKVISHKEQINEVLECEKYFNLVSKV